MDNEIKQLIMEIEEFSRERDWDQFHNPKDLAIALSIEASELLEAFLWKNPEDVKLEKVKEELADVLNYALMMALIDYCKEHTIDEILNIPDVKERIDLYFEQSEKFKEQVQRCAKVYNNFTSGSNNINTNSTINISQTPAGTTNIANSKITSSNPEHSLDSTSKLGTNISFLIKITSKLDPYLALFIQRGGNDRLYKFLKQFELETSPTAIKYKTVACEWYRRLIYSEVNCDEPPEKLAYEEYSKMCMDNNFMVWNFDGYKFDAYEIEYKDEKGNVQNLFSSSIIETNNYDSYKRNIIEGGNRMGRSYELGFKKGQNNPGNKMAAPFKNFPEENNDQLIPGGNPAYDDDFPNNKDKENIDSLANFDFTHNYMGTHY